MSCFRLVFGSPLSRCPSHRATAPFAHSGTPVCYRSQRRSRPIPIRHNPRAVGPRHVGEIFSLAKQHTSEGSGRIPRLVGPPLKNSRVWWDAAPLPPDLGLSRGAGRTSRSKPGGYHDSGHEAPPVWQTGLVGGAGGNRTHDLRVKSPLLCQLSYGPAPQDTASGSPLLFGFDGRGAVGIRRVSCSCNRLGYSQRSEQASR